MIKLIIKVNKSKHVDIGQLVTSSVLVAAEQLAEDWIIGCQLDNRLTI